MRRSDHYPVPAFYKQTRLTCNRKESIIIKFRSVKVDAEKDVVARLSTGENDDRITPVGRIVRKCCLDELPQLINILKGEMSFVGSWIKRSEIAETIKSETLIDDYHVTVYKDVVQLPDAAVIDAFIQ